MHSQAEFPGLTRVQSLCEYPLGICWTCLCQYRASSLRILRKKDDIGKAKGWGWGLCSGSIPWVPAHGSNFSETTVQYLGCFLSWYLSIFGCMVASTARILGILSLWRLHLDLVTYWASLLGIPLTSGATSTSNGLCSHVHSCTLHPANMAPSLLSVPLHLWKVLTEPIGNSISLRSHSPSFSLNSIYSSLDYLIFTYECLGPTAIMKRLPRSFEVWRPWWEFFQDIRIPILVIRALGKNFLKEVPWENKIESHGFSVGVLVVSHPSFCSIIMSPGTCNHWLKIPKCTSSPSWHSCYYLTEKV